MSTKIIEGVEYILKSSVENIIKERVSKVAQRANTAEGRIQELQSKMQDMHNSISNVDILTSKIDELQGRLSKSELKYNRYQSISKHGLHDPEMVEAIEWSYERAMSKRPEENKIGLNEWLDHQVANPSDAHALLRPHLTKLKGTEQPSQQPSQQQQQQPPQQQYQQQPSTQQPPQGNPQDVPPSQQLYREPIPAPSTNRGAIPNPEEQNFWKEASSNPKFFEQNRAQIKELWKSKRRQ